MFERTMWRVGVSVKLIRFCYADRGQFDQNFRRRMGGGDTQVCVFSWRNDLFDSCLLHVKHSEERYEVIKDRQRGLLSAAQPPATSHTVWS